MADKIHKCEICGKEFSKSIKLIKHLERTFPCKKDIEQIIRTNLIKNLKKRSINIIDGQTIYICKYCDKEFFDKQHKYRHQQTCQKKEILDKKNKILYSLSNYVDKNNDIAILDKIENIINKPPVNINIDQSINKTINNINNNNITNNFNNYNFNHINYIYTLGFGRYNIEGYTKKNGKRFKDILSKNMDRDSKDNSYNPGNLIVDIVNDTYFNKSDPTHMNVYMKDASSNQMQVYDGSGIVNYDKNTIIKNMIDHSKSNVERITGYLNISGLVNESQEQYCNDSFSDNIQIDSAPIEAKCIENTQYAVNLYHNPEFKGNPINKDSLSQYMTYDRVIK